MYAWRHNTHPIHHRILVNPTMGSEAWSCNKFSQFFPLVLTLQTKLLFKGTYRPCETSTEAYSSGRASLHFSTLIQTKPSAQVMQSEVLCVRAHVHDSPRQLVFSQTTAWKMG